MRFDGDRTPEGPVRRVASTIQHARLEVRWINHQPDRVLLVAGDWNDTPNDRGRYSPSWVAALTGRQLAARSKADPWPLDHRLRARVRGHRRHRRA